MLVSVSPAPRTTPARVGAHTDEKEEEFVSSGGRKGEAGTRREAAEAATATSSVLDATCRQAAMQARARSLSECRAWNTQLPPSSWRHPALAGRVSNALQRARDQQTHWAPPGGLGELCGGHGTHRVSALGSPAARWWVYYVLPRQREARSHQQTPGGHRDAGSLWSQRTGSLSRQRLLETMSLISSPLPGLPAEQGAYIRL